VQCEISDRNQAEGFGSSYGEITKRNWIQVAQNACKRRDFVNTVQFLFIKHMMIWIFSCLFKGPVSIENKESKRIKVGLGDHHAVCVSTYPSLHGLLNG
jgi:hypothetical protein